MTAIVSLAEHRKRRRSDSISAYEQRLIAYQMQLEKELADFRNTIPPGTDDRTIRLKMALHVIDESVRRERQ